jgi:hypothetical protein
VHLGYTGAIPEWSPLWGLGASLANPFGLEGAEGALADDMREVLRAVLAVERGHVVSLPAGRGRHATSADLRPAEET